MAKYYIIVGEASGDLHASNLMKSLKARDPDASFRFWGGDRMVAAGGELVKHIRELAFMGFWEVIANLRTIFRNIRICKRDIITYQPDVLVLVDYPGFNLRMAKFAHREGIRVVYYISPQVWAWKASRVHTIKKVVDRMLVILPFEKDFYRRYQVEVDFVGHPLLDAISSLRSSSHYSGFKKTNGLPDKPLVALLPGSREQEIKRILGVMLSVVPSFPEYQFVVAGVSSFGKSFYERYLTGADVSIVTDQTYPLLAHADAALVASGTATLEAALFGVPQAVCYTANPLSYQIARRLIKVKYISLVNLVMDKEVVREMVQGDLNATDLKEELGSLLYNESQRSKLKKQYHDLEALLGGAGASEQAAKAVMEVAKGSYSGK